ncbi:MAG: CcoQ/FixQ family Cbb3-type cytochrome c oxidase assembly chaperone [Phycisphaerales bacterium JB052]
MSMSEIVSFLDLSVFPSVALVFFLFAFFAVLIWALTRSKQEIDDAANIVLNDDEVVAPRRMIKNNTAAQSEGEGVSHV